MSIRIEAEALTGGGVDPDTPEMFEIHLSRVRGLEPEQSNLSISLPLEVARQLEQLIRESLKDRPGQ
jgi:hypothetical protein